MKKQIDIFIVLLYSSTSLIFASDDVIEKIGNHTYVNDGGIWYVQGNKGLGVKIINDYIKVKFKEKVSDKSIQNILFSTNTTIKQISHSGSYSLWIHEGSDPIEIMKEIYNSRLVEYVCPNVLATVASTPNDLLFLNYQKALHDDGMWENDIDAPEAWSIEYGDSTIIVAIIDSGVDIDHPDLSNNVKTNLSYDVYGAYDTISKGALPCETDSFCWRFSFLQVLHHTRLRLLLKKSA